MPATHQFNPENCSHSNAHQEIISGQRTGEYVCDDCGETFTSIKSLEASQEAHERCHAPDAKALSLRVCANGVDYEVRVSSDGNVFRIAGYRNSRQVTAAYSVTIIADADFQVYHGEGAVQNLVSLVTKDIIEGRILH